MVRGKGLRISNVMPACENGCGVAGSSFYTTMNPADVPVHCSRGCVCNQEPKGFYGSKDTFYETLAATSKPEEGCVWTPDVSNYISNSLFHAADNVSAFLVFLNRSIYLLLTMSTSCEKEMKLLHKLLVEVEIDEYSDFDNERNGPEDTLDDIFSDRESFREHDSESEENGDSGSE
ncbi:hypothetical protein AVEN_196041-1 [Araneus ventricosus]|uniref:Uncharacterized protein n=1 Tax=Araneus ventricosus TaxID=182803 RepID=A0A4Y2P0D8_ARAVE|nr:hypothetical protein AVEN_196041-1 [Araneus ventricosus]